MISVTITSPDPDFVPVAAWDDLVTRAQPNVFMNPAALQAASSTGFARIHVLLAWDGAGDARRLVGLWALRERRTLPLWPAVLDALPYEYAFLSSPVVDRALVAQVMPAFFDAIRTADNLPRVLSMTSLDAEAPTFNAIRAALTVGRGALIELRAEQRPMLSRDSVAKPSSERRKKMRQHWRRLGTLGATAMVFVTDPGEIATAFEAFLQLEMRSWKGAAGTALLCNDADATFVRRLMCTIAARGEAMIQTLRVGERIIAAQVVMLSGKMGYTWKTAFDGEYAKFSPGVLLIDALGSEMFRMTNVARIDSCAAETSFVRELWPDRQRMVDLLADVGPGKSMGFRMEAARLTGRQHLKTWRDRLRRWMADSRLPDSRSQKSSRSSPPTDPHPAGV